MRNPFRRSQDLARDYHHATTLIQSEARAVAAENALEELVRAIGTAPGHRWVTLDDAAVRSLRLHSDTMAVKAPHLDWRPLTDAMAKAKALLGDRRG